MADFRSLSNNELDALASEELIAYMRAAQAAGRLEEGKHALGMLVSRHLADVKRRVAIKVPPQDVEDVAMEAIISAIKSAFDGTAKGQFISWLKTIVSRRIADYWRSREGDPQLESLPEEHADAEEQWGADAAVSPDDSGQVDLQDAIDRALAELSDVHCQVVELYVFQDMSAEETADEVNKMFEEQNPPMSATNVHKIASRFRDFLRGMLPPD